MEVTVFYWLMLQKYISSKQKILKLKKCPLCLGNISKDSTADNMKKAELNGYFYKVLVDYNIVATSNIIDIHKHLMKKHYIK